MRNLPLFYIWSRANYYLVTSKDLYKIYYYTHQRYYLVFNQTYLK